MPDWVVLLLSPIPPVIIGYLLTRKRLTEIHVLVNSRLTKALEEIDILKTSLQKEEEKNE